MGKRLKGEFEGVAEHCSLTVNKKNSNLFIVVILQYYTTMPKLRLDGNLHEYNLHDSGMHTAHRLAAKLSVVHNKKSTM